MVLTERGRVAEGGIVFSLPLPLPEGAEVAVRIEVANGDSTVTHETVADEQEFASLPFFGMWAERKDMEASGARVDRERRRWSQQR